MSRELAAAAKKLSDAYRAWIEAGAEYNSLIYGMGPMNANYAVSFDSKGAKAKKISWKKRL